MQRVGDDDADDVDVWRVGDSLPVRLGALVPEPRRGVVGEVGIDVGDGDQPYRRQLRFVQGSRRPIAGRVRTPGHAGTDDRNADG